MVDSSTESKGPRALVYEDQIDLINKAFDADKHLRIGDHIKDLKASIEAGLCTKKDGSKVEKGDADFAKFLETDLAKTELWGHSFKDEFWTYMEEMESMEEFKHQALMDAEVKLFYSYEEGGKMKNIMDLNVPSDLITTSAMFYEVDLLPVWLENDAWKDVKCSIFGQPKRSLSAMDFSMSVPNSKPKYMKMQSITYLDRSTNGILNCSGSIDKETKKWFGLDLPNTPEGMEEIDIKIMYKYLERVDDETTRFVIFAEADMGKEMTKSVLMDYILKEHTVKACKALRQVYEKNIALYRERVNGPKKEFYDQLRVDFAED